MRRNRVEILRDGAGPKRTVAAGLIGAERRVFFSVLGAQVADVSMTLLDEFFGVGVEFGEVVRGEERLGAGTGRDGREVVVGAAVGGDRGGGSAFGFEAEDFVRPTGDRPADIRRD